MHLYQIPIEWVIDIADESSGWFYGTAYHYNDETNELHVMVPDKENPNFDGNVSLDFRTVHLVECNDEHSHALFNKIVRDSVMKIRWEVEWFEEAEDGAEGEDVNYEGGEEIKGTWILTMARYYIRIANQMLVEEVGFEESTTKGFVMLTADLNVKLRYCHKMKGAEDFSRLINERTVNATPEAMESLEVEEDKAKGKKGGRHTRVTEKDVTGGGKSDKMATTIQKLTEMTGGLKDSLSDVLDDREKLTNDRAKMAKSFKAFALDGDLEAGERMLEFFDFIEPGEQDALDAAADEAWFLCQSVDKQVQRLARGSDKASGEAGASSGRKDKEK